jgi:hypothetical protein
MPNVSRTDKILPILFSEPHAELTERDRQLKLMLEDIFNRCLQHPYHTDRVTVDYIMERWDIGKTQAYRYLNEVKPILGNVKNSGREFQRSRVIEMLLEAFRMAQEQKRPKEMALAAAALGKYTKLDKEEVDPVDWENLQPPSWEPSADPALLGITDAPQSQKELNELKRKLRKKYLRESFADAEVIDDNENH